MVLCNFLIPVTILSFKKLKKIPGILIASIAVVIGMWLERLIIVAPSLANPRFEIPVGVYVPTVTEWAIFIGALSVFVFGFVMFAKFFPLISIWEIEEGREESVREVKKRVEGYLPITEPIEPGPSTKTAEG